MLVKRELATKVGLGKHTPGRDPVLLLCTFKQAGQVGIGELLTSRQLNEEQFEPLISLHI